jgi:hypothetical protein
MAGGGGVKVTITTTSSTLSGTIVVDNRGNGSRAIRTATDATVFIASEERHRQIPHQG